MVREQHQIQQLTYKVDNPIYELISYPAAFRIDLNAVKRKLLVYQETIVLKRVVDIVFSSVVLTLGLPVYLMLILITKFTSRGPVFFKQQRIGKDQRPFFIYKFRNMQVYAEKHGPQLATDDANSTSLCGQVIQKTHLDELPQFWNVYKCDIANVRPRTERRHFIQDIKAHRPEYMQLLRFKPDITSIGQVQYVAAENVRQK